MESFWGSVKLMLFIYALAAVISLIIAWMMKYLFVVIRMQSNRATKAQESQGRILSDANGRDAAQKEDLTMPEIEFLSIFQGIATMVASDPLIAVARVVLIALGIAFVYWGVKGTLEPLIMIPIRNRNGVRQCRRSLSLGENHGNDLHRSDRERTGKKLLNVLQIDFLQPIYTFTFSNGLIACLVFMVSGQSRISVTC